MNNDLLIKIRFFITKIGKRFHISKRLPIYFYYYLSIHILTEILKLIKM